MNLQALGGPEPPWIPPSSVAPVLHEPVITSTSEQLQNLTVALDNDPLLIWYHAVSICSKVSSLVSQKLFLALIDSRPTSMVMVATGNTYNSKSTS